MVRAWQTVVVQVRPGQLVGYDALQASAPLAPNAHPDAPAQVHAHAHPALLARRYPLHSDLVAEQVVWPAGLHLPRPDAAPALESPTYPYGPRQMHCDACEYQELDQNRPVAHLLVRVFRSQCAEFG